MKISILTPNVSDNNLGRAHILAKVLQRRWPVEIIGPMFGDALWYPVADDKSIEYKYIKGKIRKKIYQDNTIVFIKRSKKYPYGHYLSRYKSSWMDPWINSKNDRKIKKIKAGFRKRLPGKAIYAIFLKKKPEKKISGT